MSKRKTVFTDDGEEVVQEVRLPAMTIKPKNTVAMFEELKTPSSNRKLVNGQKVAKKAPPKDVVAVSKAPPPPLPPGYKCNACGAIGEHAIYDCTSFVSKKGKKQKTAPSSSSKTAASEEAAFPTSVYITGLPFDFDIPKLKEYLQTHQAHAGIKAHGIRLVPMEDNPKKTRGVAFVTYESADQARLCITAIHGQTLNKKLISAEPSRPKPTVSPGKGAGSFKKRKGAEGGDKRCYRCGGKHEAATCTAERICYRCKSTEHLSSACPLKKNASPAPEQAESQSKRGWGKKKEAREDRDEFF